MASIRAPTESTSKDSGTPEKKQKVESTTKLPDLEATASATLTYPEEKAKGGKLN
ncbi:unnamed protein product [Acanthoscelides obtectus]|uniref:Uncharacterized protein n=1 Tax=Acanthoscelides obtectus TaxID=200917 RepID=A0A9P0KUW0_ACAOB|nr:unnamed protein product [Acanthoscelides obtectus]CAK1628571.1 hypothetical protein AOBTE_LOCUS5282 [Acanthoscelides obtectus]